ncbi:hypothetical protein FRB93_012484 [Tulasnella sp. JGI-2019a]|nr:hypothetical protein FRB93_012484 [Tulasnella sp. JGI-2019a]
MAARQRGAESLGNAYAFCMDLVDRSLLVAATSISYSHARVAHTTFNNFGRNVAKDAVSHAIEKLGLGTAVQLEEPPLCGLEVTNNELPVADRFRILNAALEDLTLSDEDPATGPAPEIGSQPASRVSHLVGSDGFGSVAPAARFRTVHAGKSRPPRRSSDGYRLKNRASGPRTPHILVVAQGNAEGESSLLNVNGEAAVLSQLPTQVTAIEGEGCTRGAVLAGLNGTAWIYFTCHGHRHPTEPFKSHFSLRSRDTPLMFLDLIKNDLSQAELAVLPACHSAAGDRSTPNEAINLAAGILFAGFRSVVGAIWAMDDRDGLVMAEMFYKHMFRNGPETVDCRDAAKALVLDVRELRKRKVPLERWIKFIHYGV